MRKILFYALFFVSSIIYGQNIPKTDTIFSVKYNYDRIENSKINLLIADDLPKCETQIMEFDRTSDLIYNSNYYVLSVLNGFDKFTKSIVFSDYKYLIFSDFCYSCEFFDKITLIEFHYTQKLKVQKFKEKIDIIINDEEYFNYPQEKLFYYKILENNVCYLLISTKNNPNNTIFENIKNKLDELK